MTRRDDDPQPGLRARYDGVCERCNEAIIARVTRVVFLRGRAIHVHCHSGADDA